MYERERVSRGGRCARMCVGGSVGSAKRRAGGTENATDKEEFSPLPFLLPLNSNRQPQRVRHSIRTLNATVRLHTGIFSSQGGVWTPSPTIRSLFLAKGTHMSITELITDPIQR